MPNPNPMTKPYFIAHLNLPDKKDKNPKPLHLVAWSKEQGDWNGKGRLDFNSYRALEG